MPRTNRKETWGVVVDGEQTISTEKSTRQMALMYSGIATTPKRERLGNLYIYHGASTTVTIGRISDLLAAGFSR